MVFSAQRDSEYIVPAVMNYFPSLPNVAQALHEGGEVAQSHSHKAPEIVKHTPEYFRKYKIQLLTLARN